MPSGRRRKLICLLFGLGGLVFGIAGAENTFGRLRAAPGAALLFSLEVRDEAGAPPARPLGGGGEGRKPHPHPAQAAGAPREPGPKVAAPFPPPGGAGGP